MPASVLDGKATALEVRREVKREAETLLAAGVEPRLSVVLVGDDPGSALYVRNKARAAKRVGLVSETHTLPADTSREALLDLLDRLNSDSRVHGVLLQLPVPGHLDPAELQDRMAPSKDVDGLHPINAGRLAQGSEDCFVPCTPAGIVRLLEAHGIEISGRRATVVGRSNLVGRPLAQLLTNRHATVTLCHTRTPDLAAETRRADLLVAAAGRPRLVTAEMVAEGATVVDVGIHRLRDGTLCGDVDAASVRERAAWLSPVPGGVGPMTIAMLLRNTVRAATRQTGIGADA